MRSPSPGLVIAMPAEADFLMGRSEWRMADGYRVKRIRMNGGACGWAVCSGIGVHNARAAARFLVDQGAGVLGVAGISGGLDPKLKPGCLVLADEICKPAGHGGPMPPVRSRISEQVNECLVRAGLRVFRGRILTMTAPVASAWDKKALFRTFHALAVDMESSAIAETAGAAGLPWFALRSICDPHDRSLPPDLISGLGPDGMVSGRKMARHLMRRPSLMVDMLKAASAFYRALISLKKGWGILANGRLPDIIARADSNLPHPEDPVSRVYPPVI